MYGFHVMETLHSHYEISSSLPMPSALPCLLSDPASTAVSSIPLPQNAFNTIATCYIHHFLTLPYQSSTAVALLAYCSMFATMIMHTERIGSMTSSSSIL